MEPEFWLSRWQANRIGFHEGLPNDFLVAQFAALGVAPGGRVFVPLCGKSQDMLWLRAQGYAVVGAELSPLAAAQFFAEAGLVPEVSQAGAFTAYETEGVRLLVGDILTLTPALLGPVDAVYDRAALVALPSVLRARYAAHLMALTQAAPQLLVTFAYDQAVVEGPPFSVEAAEVRALYGEAYRLVALDTRAVPGGIKFLAPAQEVVWLLSPP